MSATARILIAAAVLAAFAGALALRDGRGPRPGADARPAAGPETGPRPRLLELGSVTCVPCRMMEKVLEALRHDFGTQLDVEFVDVNEHPDAGHKHKIRVIPTQIFLSPEGEELFRHEGFYPKDEIVAKWRELGVRLEPRGDAAAAPAREPGLLDRLFVTLTEAVEGSWAVALGAALVWGMLSILLSPCHLASIPLIVGFVDEQGRISTRRAFLISLLFSLGILLTIALLGAASAAAGQMLGDVGPWGTVVVAVIFLAVGLHLLDVLPAPWQGPGQVGMQRKGLLAAFLLGLLFGIALGPCTFAYMAPMLAVAFRLGAEDLPFGVALLLLYGLGHCGVIVLAGTFTEMVQRYMNWNQRSRGALILKRVCGVLVILGGLYLAWKP